MFSVGFVNSARAALHVCKAWLESELSQMPQMSTCLKNLSTLAKPSYTLVSLEKSWRLKGTRQQGSKNLGSYPVASDGFMITTLSCRV